jgi:hypothetical protein
MESKWKKPELIILVRGLPEEAVLASCKLALSGSNSGVEDVACVGAVYCANCNALTGS